MNEIEIKYLLSCVKNVHICARNELNFSNEKYPLFCVINTEKRISGDANTGEHWIGLIFDVVNGKRTCFFFDSLAAYPTIVCQEIIEFAKNNSDVLRINGPRVQSPFNRTCGLHVCKFVLSYHKKFNYATFLMSYSANELVNDVNVYKLFQHQLQIAPVGKESVQFIHCQSIKAALFR